MEKYFGLAEMFCIDENLFEIPAGNSSTSAGKQTRRASADWHLRKHLGELLAPTWILCG